LRGYLVMLRRQPPQMPPHAGQGLDIGHQPEPCSNLAVMVLLHTGCVIDVVGGLSVAHHGALPRMVVIVPATANAQVVTIFG
jgi:hypothetical protein